MTNKQYQRKQSYRSGYIKGYYGPPLSQKGRMSKAHDADFMRGYFDGKRDYKEGEAPEFRKG